MERRSHKTATILYRKSNCTLNTRSRTCSGASQFLTNSSKVRLKRKPPKTNYYVGNGKVKRDLSIATDVCILRRYYKKKFGKCKCSTNTPVGTIDESNIVNSACGDNISEENNENANLNIDVTALVIENFKHLLNDWIKKYLLNNNETKQKIETVLDSILHKIEREKRLSSCTYTVNIKVNEENYSDSNVKNKASYQVQRRKQSCQTVPVSGKYIRLISTLSIPRNIKKQMDNVKSHSSKQTTRKVRYKNVFLTVSRSSTFLLNSSSFNLFSISTKSFTKRCATYKGAELNTEKKYAVLFPKSSYSESMPDASYREDTNLDLDNKIYPNVVEPMQSLVKSIFADDPANVTSTDKNVYESKNDNYTMTDTDSALKKITSCAQCHKLHWKKAIVSNEAQHATSSNIEKAVECRRKKHNYSKLKSLTHKRNIKKTKPERKTQSLKCLNRKLKLNSTNQFRKSNLSQKESNVFKDLESILKCFSHYTNSKNIKLDVRINVTPMLTDIPETEGNNYKSNNTNINNSNLKTDNSISKQTARQMNSVEISKSTTQVDSGEMQKQTDKSDSSADSEPKLISLLDGAVSQSKYVISKKMSCAVNENNLRKQKSKLPPNLEIAKDISELRVIIKDLATTTENFVREHLEHIKCNKSYVTEVTRNDKSNQGSIKSDLNASTVSKAIQISNDTIKSQIVSGLKLKKEPKKKEIQESNTRSMKRSVSYNIIESESILKVTDMTSAAVDVPMKKDKCKDKALNCSLPKSKSQLDITGAHNKKNLLAYYCDELIKSRQFIQSRNTCPANNRYTCPHIGNESHQLFNENKCNIEKERHKKIACIGAQHVPYHDEDCEVCPGYSCSSVYIGIDDHSKKFTVRSRGGVGFWEGLIYCILLWIPVLVILWLIYVYVIRDLIQPTNPAIGRNSLRSRNNSFFHITLSDLGF